MQDKTISLQKVFLVPRGWVFRRPSGAGGLHPLRGRCWDPGIHQLSSSHPLAALIFMQMIPPGCHFLEGILSLVPKSMAQGRVGSNAGTKTGSASLSTPCPSSSLYKIPRKLEEFDVSFMRLKLTFWS